MDTTIVYDTFVVAWVLYCALYFFWLGRALGASSRSACGGGAAPRK